MRWNTKSVFVFLLVTLSCMSIFADDTEHHHPLNSLKNGQHAQKQQSAKTVTSSKTVKSPKVAKTSQSSAKVKTSKLTQKAKSAKKPSQQLSTSKLSQQVKKSQALKSLTPARKKLATSNQVATKKMPSTKKLKAATLTALTESKKPAAPIKQKAAQAKATKRLYALAANNANTFGSQPALPNMTLPAIAPPSATDAMPQAAPDAVPSTIPETSSPAGTVAKPSTDTNTATPQQSPTAGAKAVPAQESTPQPSASQVQTKHDASVDKAGSKQAKQVKASNKAKNKGKTKTSSSRMKTAKSPQHQAKKASSNKNKHTQQTAKAKKSRQVKVRYYEKFMTPHPMTGGASYQYSKPKKAAVYADQPQRSKKAIAHAAHRRTKNVTTYTEESQYTRTGVAATPLKMHPRPRPRHQCLDDDCYVVRPDYKNRQIAEEISTDHEDGWVLSGGVGGQFPSSIGGSARINNGSGAPAPFDQDLYSLHSESEPLIGVTGGYRWARDSVWIPSFTVALNYQYLFSSNVGNNITQYSDPAFLNYNYKLNVSSNVLLALFKLNLFQYQQFSPYIAAGVGPAFNYVSGYQETALPGVTPRVSPAFQNRTNTQLAYTLRAGVDWILDSGIFISAEYQYLNLGSVYSGQGVGDWTGQRIGVGPFRTNVAMASIGYLFDT